MFPDTFEQDPSSASASNAASVFGSSTSLSATTKVDTSALYKEECQITLCYLVEFSNTGSFNPGEFKVIIKNLLNPESVAKTKDITITTMMKYTGDT